MAGTGLVFVQNNLHFKNTVTKTTFLRSGKGLDNIVWCPLWTSVLCTPVLPTTKFLNIKNKIMFYDRWMRNVHWMFTISYGNTAIRYTITVLTMTWCTQPWCHILRPSLYNLNTGSAWSIIYSVHFLMTQLRHSQVFLFSFYRTDQFSTVPIPASTKYKIIFLSKQFSMEKTDQNCQPGSHVWSFMKIKATHIWTVNTICNNNWNIHLYFNICH